jgi:hypothetical protein
MSLVAGTKVDVLPKTRPVCAPIERYQIGMLNSNIAYPARSTVNTDASSYTPFPQDCVNPI